MEPSIKNLQHGDLIYVKSESAGVGKWFRITTDKDKQIYRELTEAEVTKLEDKTKSLTGKVYINKGD